MSRIAKDILRDYDGPTFKRKECPHPSEALAITDAGRLACRACEATFAITDRQHDFYVNQYEVPDYSGRRD